MKKAVARPNHSSSSGGRTGGRPHRSDALKVYYCLCGEFVLVCDRPLSRLPLRPLDNARVLRCLDSPPYSITGAPQKVRKARVFKVSASQGAPKFIKRTDGTLEKQYPFSCSRCNLQLGYEHTPPPLKSGGKFTFVLPGALTERQGVPPPDAFLQDFFAQSEEATGLDGHDRPELPSAAATT